MSNIVDKHCRDYSRVMNLNARNPEIYNKSSPSLENSEIVGQKLEKFIQHGGT